MLNYESNVILPNSSLSLSLAFAFAEWLMYSGMVRVYNLSLILLSNEKSPYQSYFAF